MPVDSDNFAGESGEPEWQGPPLLDIHEVAEEDMEMLFYIEDNSDELEDEDGEDSYLPDPETDTSVLIASELPWVGDAAPPGFSASPEMFRNDRMLTVVDVSGIHELSFTFCACPNAPRQDVQLLNLGFYPASISRPRTVFTKAMLDDFLLANKECKSSARAFYNKLQCTTNAAFPHMVPVGFHH